MRRLVYIFVFLLCVPAWAAHKTFPATGGSVAAENARAEALGYERFETLREVEDAVAVGHLVPVGVTSDPKLPINRRYLRPDAADFVLELDNAFRLTTGHWLLVDSAVRPVDVQRRLRRVNRNAAPATGERASSHERGTTFDLAKKTFNGRDYNRMRRGEYRWLLVRLAYYRATGRILVIEERNCVHVFVGRLQNSPEVGRSVLDGRDIPVVLEDRQDLGNHRSPEESPDGCR